MVASLFPAKFLVIADDSFGRVVAGRVLHLLGGQ